MPLRQRLLGPAVLVLLGGLLGLAPPASAADPASDPGAGRQRAVARYHDLVKDPRGDVQHPFGEDRGAEANRHADILRATYRTPWQAGHNIVVTVQWAELRDGRSTGVRKQQQLTMLEHPSSGRTWFFFLGNAGGPAKLFAVDQETGESERVVPQRITVDRSPGVGGRTVVRLSTEWLTVDRLRFHTFSQSRDALDEVAPSLLLDVVRH